MFFLISGGPAAGKSTIAKHISNRVDRVICQDQDEREAPDAETRCQHLEEWVQKAVELEQEGQDFLLAGNSPLGELLACPSARKLEAISAGLVDCSDQVRVQRFRARGIHPKWPLSQHVLNWASWHRMHAWDPQWEQDVIVASNPPNHVSSRWTSWEQFDKRWSVHVIDTTNVDIEHMLASVAVWIQSEKEKVSALSREAGWWE